MTIVQPVRVTTVALVATAVPSRWDATLRCGVGRRTASLSGATMSSTSTDPLASRARTSIAHMAVYWSSVRATSRILKVGRVRRTAVMIALCGECPG